MYLRSEKTNFDRITDKNDFRKRSIIQIIDHIFF